MSNGFYYRRRSSNSTKRHGSDSFVLTMTPSTFLMKTEVASQTLFVRTMINPSRNKQHCFLSTHSTELKLY